ncbi:hypothetical protein [uncultured Tateyamaria sp.]|uniref:hypothetical protein n=1 Tax=uncultured Tateyamaria sp. TaxID=455651 RepID=UPI002636D536|nr:hypothetical protein [uncultured Tateyamaria sp.]
MTRSSAQGRTDAGHDLFKGMTKKKKAKDSKKDTQPPIQVGEHGRYQIKSGLLAGKFVARAFAKPPTKARGMIAEASGATQEAAITALHDVIDARESKMTENRRTDPHTGASVPSIEEYTEALGQVALTRPQRALLAALSLADEDGLTEVRVANGAGYKSRASANRSLASAGRLIATFLSSETVSNGSSTNLDGTAVLGFRGEPEHDGDPGNWILYPELRDAIRAAL